MILITGDKGFVGTATKKELEEHTQVSGYDLMRGHDIRDYNHLYDFVKQHRPFRIIHLAAIARFSEADKDPLRALGTNVKGTYNVVRVADAFRIPLVYASTGSVYMPIKEKPPITEEFQTSGNSIYGCTKLMGEEYVKRMKAPWIILRYAHLYGKEKRYHGLIGGFAARIQRGMAPTLYGGKQSNDFTYIEDVARANRAAIEAPWDSWCQVYNIGTGEELTAQKAGEMICQTMHYNGTIDTKEARTVDPQHFVYDTKKAEEMLGFKAQYNFKQGLREMYGK